MNERDQAEIERTLKTLDPIALDLRRRGFDAGLNIDTHVTGYVMVELQVRVPPQGIPIESVQP